MDLGTQTIVTVIAAGLLAAAVESSACRQPPTAEQAAPLRQTRFDTRAPTPPERMASKPESDGDRDIRRALRTAIEQDPMLKDRAISFTVDNGDVTVTGLVGSETERQKINELAMQIAGVKSVANALRVSPS